MNPDELFAAAQNAVKTRSDLGNEDKLRLYAHYKQGVVGQVSGQRPGRFDVVNRAKWDAWNNLGSMSQEDAKNDYCVLVDGFVPGWRPSKEPVSQAPAQVQRNPSRRRASIPSEVPVQKPGTFGFRRWLAQTIGGETFEVDASLAAHGEFLPAAQSLADKFLLLCVLDSDVQPLYSKSTADLPRLKAQIVEALLIAFRADFGAGEGVPAEPLSLAAHRTLSEHHIARLRAHLGAAVKEHCATAIEGSCSVEAMSAQLLNAHGIPVTLLPRVEAAENVGQATALKSKGGGPGAKVGGLEFAPLNVPLSRRRQTLACAIGSTLILECMTLTGLCLYFWRFTWPLFVPYLAWGCYFDRSAWKGGMKVWRWLRRSWVFKHWAEYFPASLIKANPEADFDGKRPVMMGYHPHGILSFGALLNVGTDCTGWSEKFPKLIPRLCTLNVNFRMPFLRELVGHLGCIPASEGSIRAALKPGNAVVVVVGGAAEALDTKPGQYVLTLKRRKGFFRLALQHGADLVPSFGFGENDIYETIEPRSILRTLQLRMYKAFSFSMPIFYGRSVFTYNAGVLPYRRPLTVVVGEPIRVEQKPNPTSEEIEALKEQYIAALRRLYEEWQPRLEPGRETPLMII